LFWTVAEIMAIVDVNILSDLEEMVSFPYQLVNFSHY